MAVYRRDSKKDGPRWVCDFTLAGNRVNCTLPNARTKREAVLAEARLREEYKARLSRSGTLTSLTVETAIERYVSERLRPKTKPTALGTYLSYLGLIRTHFGPDTPIQRIGNPAVAEWWGVLVEKVQANTAKRYLTVLKALLGFAKEAGAGNEVPTFSPTVKDDTRVRWLSREEEAALLEAAPSWLADLVTFYVETGARKAEALGVRWRDVDFERQGRGLVRLYETKGGDPRGIPLTRRAQELLTRLEATHRHAKADDRVFLWPDRSAGEAARMVPVGDFKKAWGAAAKRAKIDDLHVHDLRHTFASRLVMRGVPLFQVSRLLGHKSLKMTMRYAHLAPEALDDAVAALDRPVSRLHAPEPLPVIPREDSPVDGLPD